MKKILLIVLAATILVISSCGSTSGGGAGTDTPTVNAADQFWFVTREEGGMPARNNQINLLRGDNYVYVYFRGGMPGADFEKFNLEFVAEKELGVSWQAAYDGGVWGAEEYIGIMDKGQIETDFASFTIVWWPGPESTFQKSLMNGICLKVNNPEGRALFTVLGVDFIGLQD
jgi:hypothetical protein